MPDLGKFLRGRGTDAARWGIRTHQMRETRFNRVVAPAQGIVVRIGDRRRIILVVVAIVGADLGR